MQESKFTGSAWGLFGWNILLVLSIYLLIIPVVFVIPKYFKWYYSHMEIDGKKLQFEYEGPWWGFLGWILFIFITLGLGSFYASKKIMQFTIENTKVVGESGELSSFDGSAWGLLGWSLLTSLCTYLLFIPLAFVIISVNEWYNKHTKFSGRQLTFKHDGPWFGIIGWMLFSLVTLGIGSFYAQKKQLQWSTAHTHFIE